LRRIASVIDRPGLILFGLIMVGILFVDAYTSIGKGRNWPLTRAFTGAVFYSIWFLSARDNMVAKTKWKMTQSFITGHGASRIARGGKPGRQKENGATFNIDRLKSRHIAAVRRPLGHELSKRGTPAR
jgi:hypothetical protein